MLDIKNFINAVAIGIFHKENPSNNIEYLGEAFFPTTQKAGLTLKWFVGANGLPVSLKASAFDTVSTIRSREGLIEKDTEMAFFKESMLVKEKDEQAFMELASADSALAKEILGTVFADADNLVKGADVVPERMIWSLLAPQGTDGHPVISIASDGATYEYDYDPNGTWVETNYVELSGTSVWTDLDDSDPLKDVDDLCDAIEEKSGTRPAIMVIAKETMSYLKKNEKLRGYVLAQNPTANVMMTDAKIVELFSQELQLSVIVYNKKFKNESGQTLNFMPNGFVSLLPSGNIGRMYKGVTPDERAKQQDPKRDTVLTDKYVAITTSLSNDPVQKKVTVSEICLPSWELMDACGAIKAY